MEEYLSADIKLKKQNFLFLLITVIGLSFNNLYSQNIQVKPTRQSSFEAFSAGNFEEAFSEFSQLLLTYPKDPLYKYYSGVCLVKMNSNPGEALTLLHQALQGAAGVKLLPSDALFYLGRSQQMSGMFLEAIVSYNLFTEKVGKKTAREQGVSEFIHQCNEKKGQVTEPDIELVKIDKSDKVDVSKTENKPVMKDSIKQPVEKEIIIKEDLSGSYEKMLSEALEFQFKADSLNAITIQEKKELEKLPNSEKPVLKVKISGNELLAISFQKSADQKYSEAQASLNLQQEITQQKDALQQSDNKVIKDSVKQSDYTIIKVADKQLDTVDKIISVVKKPVETFAFFKVLTKPVSDPNEKIIIDPEVSPGLIYRIQIAVFRNPVAPAFFKGISPVYGFKITGTDRTNYYAGMFRRYSDANNAIATVKAKGFKDAFIIAFSGNKPVSADRAAILEKEWGKKPFAGMVKTITGTPVDTVPPTLSFRVEVIRSLKPLKDDVLEGIKKLADSHGLDIQPLDDGNIVYLIGKFITFESAEEYADLLMRNGYREAKVGAWLGKREIPVDTARQLFENLK